MSTPAPKASTSPSMPAGQPREHRDAGAQQQGCCRDAAPRDGAGDLEHRPMLGGYVILPMPRRRHPSVGRDDAGSHHAPPWTPRDRAQHARRVEHFLRTEEVLWLSTFGTDGFPGLVPIWFSWDGEAILVVSKPHAEKVADMRADPRVMVALGNAEEDFDVGLIEARAELVDMPADGFLPESHWAKYAADLAGIGLTREEYVRAYSQAVRLVPVRYLGWRGRIASPASAKRPGGRQPPVRRAHVQGDDAQGERLPADVLEARPRA